MHGSKLSTSALKILISLSEAHAKLSLRNKVIEEDVLIAVLLYESSLTLKHGNYMAFSLCSNFVMIKFGSEIACKCSPAMDLL
ncbi:hypothetical protein NDU88_001675 [Pleurodeles waltl]|uniref:Uncharacterized protein n=1 Tax=Pleurodeles waltl TaxID=8319 RepID=A0AAV7UTF5_PLEWA|nr:hypothetical protein NDU88_001675 [Pleurodeles waltl]